jgi:hypothetical protein
MRPERATYHHFTALDSSDNNRTRERGKGKEGRSVTVVECIEGVYEIQDVEFGKVYKWCPENVLVDCECGKRLTLTRLESTCGWCSADHAGQVQEALKAQQLEDEVVHPWRYVGDQEGIGLPC